MKYGAIGAERSQKHKNMSEKNENAHNFLAQLKKRNSTLGRTNLGVYEVNGVGYHSKVTAILEAQNQGQTSNIQWNFNEDAYSKHNWTVEPDDDLLELYRQRAQQLREKYDWLVLYFSGGSDSRTILETFLTNGIRIDEIFVWAYPSVNRKLVWGNDFYCNGNNLAEFDIITKPYLDSIHAAFPKIKISIHDWTSDIIDSYKKDDWIMNTASRLSPNAAAKRNIYGWSRDLLQHVDKGYQVGHILGVDKPIMMLKNGKYYIAFLDKMIAAGIAAGRKRDSWEQEELFFWTPDLPQLQIKQAHIIRNWFEKNPHKKKCIRSGHGKWDDREEFNTIVKKLVYPNWDISIWQIEKSRSTTFINQDKWFWDSDLPEAKIWKNGLKTLDEILPDSWMTNGSVTNELVGCWSKEYYIGDSVSQVEKTKSI